MDSRQLTTPNIKAFWYSLLGILDISHGKDWENIYMHEAVNL